MQRTWILRKRIPTSKGSSLKDRAVPSSRPLKARFRTPAQRGEHSATSLLLLRLDVVGRSFADEELRETFHDAPESRHLVALQHQRRQCCLNIARKFRNSGMSLAAGEEAPVLEDVGAG